MVVIDTSSLVSLVRYYLPFDKESTLFNFLKRKVEMREIIIIDKVFDECRNIAKGLVTNALPFLENHKKSTELCLPDKQFWHLLDHDFVNQAVRKKLADEIFEVRKTAFLNNADAKLILFCRQYNNTLSGMPRIITEETESNNDNKEFKKIPSLCKPLSISTITLPEFLAEQSDINCVFQKALSATLMP